MVSGDNTKLEEKVNEVLEMLEPLEAIIERNNFKIIFVKNNSIIVYRPMGKEEIKVIAYAAMEKLIVLTNISLFVTNITEIYDKVVFSVNRDFGKASAIATS
jgi:ABC-2 type transport system ATP-binding protein